ncbi:MAG: hypothetical protein LBL52_04050 [Rickettsiales bacterium]|jgi:hypothetical protein|nr:hypothetical protein [Rickettsiales bacterium]
MKALKFLLLLTFFSSCEDTGEYVVEYTQIQPGSPAAPAQRPVPKVPVVPIYERKIPRTFENVEKFNLEIEARCRVDWASQHLISSEPFSRDSFKLERTDKGDPLPTLNVENLSFKDKTASEVMGMLLKNTGIRLNATDIFTKRLEATGIGGNLAQVLDLVASMGSVYYTYDSRTKSLELKRHASFNLQVPLSDEAVLAVEDALRGADIDGIVVDWEDRTLIFNGDSVVEDRARNTIAKLSLENYLIAYDVNVFRAYPKTGGSIEWQHILKAFDKGSVKLSQKGVIGRALVVGPNFNASSLAEFLYPRADTALISAGTFVMPERWQGRFDIGRCTRDVEYETDLGVLAEARFTADKDTVGRIDATVVLRTAAGDIAKYSTPVRLGNNILIIGIPTQYFASGTTTELPPTTELIVLISPRIIRIVKPEAK